MCKKEEGTEKERQRECYNEREKKWLKKRDEREGSEEEKGEDEREW